MKIVLIASIAIGSVVVLGLVYWLYAAPANPLVVRELIEHPEGKRAQRVMLLTLPSGRRIPVNYFREDPFVYAAADGRWWKELVGAGFPVTLLVRGETLPGVARAVLDDPAYLERVFEKLRPNAIKGFGKLIEIRVDDSAAGS